VTEAAKNIKAQIDNPRIAKGHVKKGFMHFELKHPKKLVKMQKAPEKMAKVGKIDPGSNSTYL